MDNTIFSKNLCLWVFASGEVCCIVMLHCSSAVLCGGVLCSVVLC